MNSTLSQLYDTDKRRNNSLLELNMVQYKRLKEHCVHVSEMRYNNKDKNIYYDRIRYGKCLSTTKEHLKYAGSKKSR